MFDLATVPAVLFPKNSPVLWSAFSKIVFKESRPVSSNCFLYFLANDKNLYPITLFRMGLLGVTHGWGKVPPPLNLQHVSYNDETWHTYNLLKEDPKNI